MQWLIRVNPEDRKWKYLCILVFIGHAQSVHFSLQHFGDFSHLVAKLQCVKYQLGRKIFYCRGTRKWCRNDLSFCQTVVSQALHSLKESDRIPYVQGLFEFRQIFHFMPSAFLAFKWCKEAYTDFRIVIRQSIWLVTFSSFPNLELSCCLS